MSRTHIESALLGAAAALYLGYHVLVVGLDSHDAGQYETVLAGATSAQLRLGFASLYGPYSGENPAVLMHAPTYYRLVGLGALVPSRLGVDPIDASLVVGRFVSVLSTLVILGMVHRLARADGVGTRAGNLATLLVASSPILGVLAVMLRPDALGVALATSGLVLVLEAQQTTRRVAPGPRIRAAYCLFALAICVKQQNLVIPLASTFLLLIATIRGRLAASLLPSALAVGAVVGISVLWIEDFWTGGLMTRTVIELPGGAFRELNYGGWNHAWTILGDCAKRSAGLLTLGALAWLTLRGRAVEGSLDRMLAVLLAAEIVALVPLCLYNKGAADNYALQAVVVAAALVGRMLDRALRALPSWSWSRVPLVIAAVLLLVNDARLIRHLERCRREEARSMAALLQDPCVGQCRADSRYFAGDQEFNRLHGRRDLIHDEWLYGAFETIGATEPRSSWLKQALTDGSITQLVLAHGEDSVPGVEESVDELGFEPLATFGPYRVWTRR